MKTVVNTSDNNSTNPNTETFFMSYYGIKGALNIQTPKGPVKFPVHARDTLLYLMSWKTDEIYPSRDRIAKQIGHSIESVKRAIKFLEEHGLITVGKKVTSTQQVNLYTVVSLQEAMQIIGNSGEVKNESGPTVGNKAQSVKPSNSPTESTPENTHDARPVGIDDSHSAEPVNTEQPAQSTQLPPVIVEEQPAEPEEEEEEPDFNSYAAMAAPAAFSGWVTTHNATVELKAAYEAHRNAHHAPRYVPHPAAHHAPEYDGMEAF
ncbi:hypothetical protein QO199_14925 [Serratia bockelmannii]|uniref:Helix-turn-helix domain-containing protein n=1 Tax=Serratia bockelmannii TaxID=2703793 RepID=A0ABT8LRL6_9GAMM|nr:hypothetical protein [Serratia bockelmannii]MDN6879948.1 hypothetical protein [Serratia bockelmannii]HBH6889294.1 hypothetical protein [Serratia marcescens]